MHDNQHLSSQFDEELAYLRSHVLQMGGLVETQIAAAIASHDSGDLSATRHIIDTDQQVNELEKTIDDRCTQLIARRQPAASDLRLVFAITKIVTDLERAGDEAKKIAKKTQRIIESGQRPGQYGSGVRHVGEAALNMMRAALDAFARLDSTEAERVIASDQAVDQGFKSIVRQLITHMMEDPRTITTALDIIWVARAVERIGDHAKNVAEHVVFIVEGRDIRHPAKDQSA